MRQGSTCDLQARQFELDCGADAELALDSQFAAVQFSQPFGHSQPQAGALLLVNFSLELHVGANFRDVLGFHPPTAVADAKNKSAVADGALDLDRAARRGEFKSVLQQLTGDLGEIIL